MDYCVKPPTPVPTPSPSKSPTPEPSEPLNRDTNCDVCDDIPTVSYDSTNDGMYPLRVGSIVAIRVVLFVSCTCHSSIHSLFLCYYIITHTSRG